MTHYAPGGSQTRRELDVICSLEEAKQSVRAAVQALTPEQAAGVADLISDDTDGGPGNSVGLHNFPARWTGKFTLNADSHTFAGESDDGIRAWVDGGAPLIDAWVDRGPTMDQPTKTLTAGQHEVKMEYYESAGGVVARPRWLC